jgi:FkbH-like protein
MLAFTKLKNNLKKSFDGMKPVRVALLADSASQHLALAVKGYGYERGIKFEIFEAGYDQIEQQVFDFSSELYAFNPEIIIISKSTHKLVSNFYATAASERNCFAQKTVQHINSLIYSINSSLTANIILLNFSECNDGVFGNYANKIDTSFLYQVRKLNLLLMEEAQKQQGLFICDVQQLTNQYGLKQAVDHKNLLTADLTWSLDFIPVLAKNIVDIIEALKGSFKKCLILDLDNTIWGGVIGDDGIEGIQLGSLGIGKAFSQLQGWIKELGRRGIILCVCSKNTEHLVKEVFEKHPDMILKLEDIAVFAVNWENKVDNIHFIKATLNIGFDSIVFLDDNPFEREMVKSAIPELTVPELPEDPADYLSFLQDLNLFETASYTEEDQQRTILYQQEAERVFFQQVYNKEDDYLVSLQMQAEVHSLNGFTIPRAAQLSQRSNQYNLRTVRYSEAELTAIAAAEDYLSFVVSLQDKFGDYGFISLIVLRKISLNKLFIDTWIMSCRVLKRSLENFILNHIISIAKSNNCTSLIGEYKPTAKNELVKEHYQNLGFQSRDGVWYLDTGNYENKNSFIKRTAATQLNVTV